MVPGRSQPAAAPPDGTRSRSPRSAPAVPGKARGQPRHGPVAQHLGHDRSGGDRQRTPVTTDDASHRAGQRRRLVAVDQGKIRRRGSRATARRIASNAARRMLSRSISATEAAPTAISARPDRRRPGMPPAAARVSASWNYRAARPAGGHAGRKYHGGRDDRAGERAAPGLVRLPRPARPRAFPAKSLARNLISNHQGVGPIVIRQR